MHYFIKLQTCFDPNEIKYIQNESFEEYLLNDSIVLYKNTWSQV